MLMDRRAFFLLLAILCAVALFNPATAQASQRRAEQFTVSLLPQYDEPSLFLTYEATLAEAGGRVAFGVPFGVRLDGAYYRDGQGRWEKTEASFEARPDGRVIRFEAAAREVRLEMHWDVIPGGAERFVDFTLPPQDFDIGVLRWVTAFPSNSSGIVTDPSMAPQGKNHFGMQEYVRESGSLQAGETAAQTIEWVRPSDEPVIDPVDGEPAPEPADDFIGPLYVGIGFLFLLGLVLVAHGFWRMKQRAGPI